MAGQGQQSTVVSDRATGCGSGSVRLPLPIHGRGQACPIRSGFPTAGRVSAAGARLPGRPPVSAVSESGDQPWEVESGGLPATAGSPSEADPFEILSTNGGYRATDAYEVFPKLEKGPDGSFRCRFFLHGWRHVTREAQDCLDRLAPGEALFVTLELTNPKTQFAVQIQTTDYYMIGWAPRYLVLDLVKAITDHPREYAAHVVQVNPQPAPSKQRVLIEMDGKWDDYEPMSGSDYRPVVGD